MKRKASKAPAPAANTYGTGTEEPMGDDDDDEQSKQFAPGGVDLPPVNLQSESELKLARYGAAGAGAAAAAGAGDAKGYQSQVSYAEWLAEYSATEKAKRLKSQADAADVPAQAEIDTETQAKDQSAHASSGLIEMSEEERLLYAEVWRVTQFPPELVDIATSYLPIEPRYEGKISFDQEWSIGRILDVNLSSKTADVEPYDTVESHKTYSSDMSMHAWIHHHFGALMIHRDGYDRENDEMHKTAAVNNNNPFEFQFAGFVPDTHDAVIITTDHKSISYARFSVDEQRWIVPPRDPSGLRLIEIQSPSRGFLHQSSLVRWTVTKAGIVLFIPSATSDRLKRSAIWFVPFDPKSDIVYLPPLPEDGKATLDQDRYGLSTLANGNSIGVWIQKGRHGDIGRRRVMIFVYSLGGRVRQQSRRVKKKAE